MTTCSREWRFLVADMIGSCEKAIAYPRDMEMNEFVADRMTRDATMWNIGLIGDAAANVPDEIRESFPNIEWDRIIEMRNQLVQWYFDVRNNIVWNTIKTDIPKMLGDLREMLKHIDAEKS